MIDDVEPDDLPQLVNDDELANEEKTGSQGADKKVAGNGAGTALRESWQMAPTMALVRQLPLPIVPLAIDLQTKILTGEWVPWGDERTQLRKRGLLIITPDDAIATGEKRMGLMGSFVIDKGKYSVDICKPITRVTIDRVSEESGICKAVNYSLLKDESSLRTVDLRRIDYIKRINRDVGDLGVYFVGEQDWLHDIDAALAEGIRAHYVGLTASSLYEPSLRKRIKIVYKALERRVEHVDKTKKVNLETRLCVSRMPENTKVTLLQMVDKMGHSSSQVRASTQDAVTCIVDIFANKPVRPRAINLEAAQRLLDESHSGLQEVKNHIMDYIARLAWGNQNHMTAGINYTLCLIGPPGTGKSTIAQTIAQATGRTLIRIPLEAATAAFIQGADRVYTGARPGEILRRLSQMHLRPNQVLFLLDEIDKMSSQDSLYSIFPSVLSLLDPAQNTQWRDQFISEVGIDLSGALFVATANEEGAIPAPLLDRMRIVRIKPYTREEQVQIVRQYILPKQIRLLGLGERVTVDNGVINTLVYDYSAQDGCRGLEKNMETILTRALRLHLRLNRPIVVDRDMAKSWLGENHSNKIGFGF